MAFQTLFEVQVRQNSKGEKCLVLSKPKGPPIQRYGYSTTRACNTPFECPWCNKFCWTIHRPFQYFAGEVCAKCYPFLDDTGCRDVKITSETLNTKVQEMLEGQK